MLILTCTPSRGPSSCGAPGLWATSLCCVVLCVADILGTGSWKFWEGFPEK